MKENLNLNYFNFHSLFLLVYTIEQRIYTHIIMIWFIARQLTGYFLVDHAHLVHTDMFTADAYAMYR